MGGGAAPPRPAHDQPERGSGARPARCPDRRRGRAAPGAARLCRRRQRRLHGQAPSRSAQHAAGRSGHRHRQDAGLSRPGLALGGRSAGHGVGVDLYQGAAAPARPRIPAPLSRSGARGQARGGAQGAGKLSLPAQSGGCAPRGLFRPRRHIGAAGRALGRLHQGWRHGGRRPARLAAHALPSQRIDRADRPARRVHLCGLPPLSQMLHRAIGPRQRRRRHRHRQPCAGDDQRRARPRNQPTAAAHHLR